ncbi:transcriptional accessory protein Tex, putative, partial [Streptococcus agalactiae H36B]
MRDDFEAPVLRHDGLDVSDLKVGRDCRNWSNAVDLGL